MKILLLALVMLLGYAHTGNAQTIAIRGTVTDDSGRPLSGVFVNVKGTTTGTSTIADGTYSISSQSAQGTLVFTYLGMVTQEIAIRNRTAVNAVMKEDVASTGEVIVIGYGTVKREHLTGAVAVATDADIKKSTTSNITQALVGKLPGIVSQQNNGAPGADGVTMLVRGYSSYTGSSPLYIVDGVERPIGNIDPNDIESVTVLKDAGSTAVYGIKAANGVILVTTKKGQQGKAQVNFRGSVTLSQNTTMPKFMNGTQYMQYYNLAQALKAEALGNPVPTPFFSDDDIAATYNGDPTDGFENTDWMSTMFKTTVMQRYSLSVSGGTEKVSYFISGGYLDQNGFVQGHKNRVGSFRSNVDATPMKNVKVSLNVSVQNKNNYSPGAYSYDNWKSYNIFHLMMYSLPYVPKEWNGEPTSAYRNSSTAANPEYGVQNSGFSKNNNLYLETSANIEYSAPFVKGLKAGMFVSWDWSNNDGKTFSIPYSVFAFTPANKGNAEHGYSWTQAANITQTGNMYTGGSQAQTILLRPHISYQREFGKHNVSAIFLYEQTQGKTSAYNSSRSNFALYDLPEINFGDSSTAQNGGSSGHSAYASYIGRADYVYADRYIAEFAFRYDASYLFPKDTRWGFFPSVSLGWVMSRENFFRDALPKIEYFKLRGSVGLVGNDNISPYLYRKIYGWNNNSVAFGTSPKSQNTLANTVSYPQTDLTWEKTRKINGGFEMSAWNGLLGVEFDVFYGFTYDILQDPGAIYPPSLGGHYPSRINEGTFDSRGFELVLKHRNRIGSFSYGVNANLTYANNRILRRNQSDNTLPWQNRLGSSIGDIWGLQAIGLFQTEEQLQNAPLAPSGVKPALGDIMYVDTNGDGKITSDDYVKIARDRMPKMMFAFMLDGDWKGLDFSIQLQGGAITDKMLQYQWTTEGQSSNATRVTDQVPLTVPFYANYDNSPLYLVEGSWTPDHTNAEYPRLTIGSNSHNAQISSFWKRNGAYLRLKNVTVGYSLPAKWMQKINMDGLRIYASGYNLLTTTQFKWTDPESSSVITGYYPQQRTFSFGVDLTF